MGTTEQKARATHARVVSTSSSSVSIAYFSVLRLRGTALAAAFIGLLLGSAGVAAKLKDQLRKLSVAMPELVLGGATATYYLFS